MTLTAPARQERAPHAVPKATIFAVVASACLAQIIIVLDTTIIAVALPSAQADMGFADSQRQWTVTAYTLAFGSLLLLGGRISQRLGIGRSFVLGLAGFSLASLVGGMATDISVFLAARVAQGVFAALLAPTNLNMMNTAFPESKDRTKAFALFGAVAGAGAAIGLILGGVLTDAASWRWCLWVNLPLALLAGALSVRTRSVVPGPSEGGLGDALGLVLGSLAVFSAVFAFSRAEEDGWGAASTVGLLGGALVLLACFVWRQQAARDPLLPLSILTDRVRASSYLCIGCVGLAQMGASLYLTYYFQQQLGYGPTATGLHFLPLVGGLVVAAMAGTRFLVPRLGVRVVFPLGSAVQAVAFWMLSSIGPNSPYGDDLALPLALAGVGIGLVMAPAMSAATAGVAARYSGLASAVANTSQQVGASLGVAYLSTWAARHVADGMQERRTALGADVVAAVRRAGAAPGSPQALEITDSVRRAALSAEAVSAYGSGFLVLCVAAASLTLVTFALLVRGDNTREES